MRFPPQINSIPTILRITSNLTIVFFNYNLFCITNLSACVSICFYIISFLTTAAGTSLYSKAAIQVSTSFDCG